MNNEMKIAVYLKENFPIEQMRYQMYVSDDIYHEIPTLVFRFSKEIDESIYDELRKCVESFNGKLRWTEFKSFFGKKIFNHTICPKQCYEKNIYMYKTGNILSDKKYFSEEEYKYLCEKAIEDIPNLYEHIRNNFKPNLEEYRKVRY